MNDTTPETKLILVRSLHKATERWRAGIADARWSHLAITIVDRLTWAVSILPEADVPLREAAKKAIELATFPEPGDLDDYEALINAVDFHVGGVHRLAAELLASTKAKAKA
jgi:hypothetical protein